ncbi:hypothetical protein VTK56DRAFT_649 [Thermocarpiscus australiensis]
MERVCQADIQRGSAAGSNSRRVLFDTRLYNVLRLPALLDASVFFTKHFSTLGTLPEPHSSDCLHSPQTCASQTPGPTTINTLCCIMPACCDPAMIPTARHWGGPTTAPARSGTATAEGFSGYVVSAKACIPGAIAVAATAAARTVSSFDGCRLVPCVRLCLFSFLFALFPLLPVVLRCLTGLPAIPQSTVTRY